MATERATVSLSPVSSTGVRPRSRSWRMASAEVGLTASATTSTPRAAPSQPTATAVLPSASAAAMARSSSGLRCWDHSASSRARPTSTACPSTTPCTPRPSMLAKPSTGGSVPTGLGGALGDGLGDGVLGGVLQGAGQPQQLLAVLAGSDDDVEQGHPAGGDGAGLVQDDGVDLAGALQHLRALDEDAELGAAAGADHERGRRGQARGRRGRR